MGRVMLRKPPLASLYYLGCQDIPDVTLDKLYIGYNTGWTVMDMHFPPTALEINGSQRRNPGGSTQSGFIRGCAAPGSESLPYFRESRTPKTYPILGKSHNPGHPKRSGLQKHTLF